MPCGVRDDVASGEYMLSYVLRHHGVDVSATACGSMCDSMCSCM